MIDEPSVDFFISYNKADRAWAEWIAWELENKVGLDTIIQAWDFRPGGNFVLDMDRAIREADRIIAVLSPDYLAAEYTHPEWAAAFVGDPQGRRRRLVPVRVRACRPRGLLGAVSYIDLVGKDEPDAALELLRGVDAAGRVRPAAAPGFPGDAQKPVFPPELPRLYLETLKERHSYVQPHGMGGHLAQRMELRQVYTRLRASQQLPEQKLRVGAEAGDPETARSDLELREVLARCDDAALIGDPGSGKTTFLRFVAQNLARLLLDAQDAEARAGLGIKGEPPLPVFVRLADFGRHLESEQVTSADLQSAPEPFYRFLEKRLHGFPVGLPADYLRRRVLEGGCFLLLDGLDEVPGQALRERVARIVEEVVLAGRPVGNRHLITSRTRAYEGRARLAAGISTFHLAPFGEPQIKEFVRGWCRALYGVHPEADATDAKARDAETYGKDLLRAIEDHENLGALIENPLMLTVIAVVYWDREGRLPEQRAELYHAAVEYLLASRSEHSPHPDQLRRECLQTVALRMVNDRRGVQPRVGRDTAAEIVVPLLDADEARAIEFLDDEALYSGLLVSRTEGEVEFWHLTFQEYLAALELSSSKFKSRQRWEIIGPHLDDPAWNEVVLLLAGCLRRTGGTTGAAEFIRQVLERGRVGLIRRILGGRRASLVARARAVGLVGRILQDIKPYGGDPARDTGYDRALHETLAIFGASGASIGEKLRVEVGEALGQAGDPRLVDAAANRVAIEGGTFWMGAQKEDRGKPGYDEAADDDESPVHRVKVSDFRLGRFPVTVQEYEAFLKAGARGYLNKNNWTPDGWAWREGSGRAAPGDWKRQLRYPNRPVTQVTWWEAEAYCRWDGGRLPTEAEWEYAARGSEGRKYPWGSDAPTERHASFSKRVDHATPVGIYPQGPTADGLHDMAGNVWEWCADFHGEYTSEDCKDPTGPASGSARVLRGGAFFDDPVYLRASCRSFYVPGFDRDGDDGFGGFRVAWSPPAGQ